MLIALIYLGIILRAFSQRIGEVTKMPPYYRWFFLGTSLLVVSTLSYTFISSAVLTDSPKIVLTPAFVLLLFHLPFTLGILINLSVALRYWGWLIRKA
jgi:hypothetical protein